MNLRRVLLGFQQALLDAQVVSRDQHREQLARYLDDHDEPLTMTVLLPAAEGEGAAAGGRTRIEVPLYSLLPHRSLEMKDAEIELEVDVGALSGEGETALEAAELDLSELDVRLVAPPGHKGPRARLRVRFEAARMSEELPEVELELIRETASEG